MVTAASYKAVADFLNATFEVSRDMLARRPLDLRRDTGIWMEKSVVTTTEKMAAIRQKISDLRDEIIALDKEEAERDGLDPAEMVRFIAMLFLTPEFFTDEDEGS